MSFKLVSKLHLVALYTIIGVCVWKSNIVEKVTVKLGIAQPAELSPFYKEMTRAYRGADGAVPDGSVILIGDSITQGLPVSLLGTPSANYGIGWDTTYGVLKRLPDYTDSISRSSAVVLAIGVNDLKRRSDAEILANYDEIISALLPLTSNILISAIQPLDGYSVEFSEDFNNDRITLMNQSLLSFAEQEPSVRYLNSYKRMANSDGHLRVDYHTGDGIHLNAEGNLAWAECLRRALDSAEQLITCE